MILFVSQPPPPWMNTAMGTFNASELTPSESLVTSDDEEVKVIDNSTPYLDITPGPSC